MGWQIQASLILLLASACVYGLQIILFDNTRDTFFYLLQDVAFIPIQVLLVTLVINRVLNEREKKTLLNKLNMVIGVFYSSVGTEVIGYLLRFDTRSDEMRRELRVQGSWTAADFAAAAAKIQAQEFALDIRQGDLGGMRDFLMTQRDFLIRLLENQNLLEHATFTDLLWAVFHLTDELARREDLARMPGSDQQHLTVDVERAYRLLIIEWLAYMKHLQSDYPYLFSLAARINPFREESSVVVRP